MQFDLRWLGLEIGSVAEKLVHLALELPDQPADEVLQLVLLGVVVKAGVFDSLRSAQDFSQFRELLAMLRLGGHVLEGVGRVVGEGV